MSEQDRFVPHPTCMCGARIDGHDIEYDGLCAKCRKAKASEIQADKPRTLTQHLRITSAKMINVSDWDRLVKQTYGRPYNFQQQDGCKSRGIVRISVPDEPDDYERDTVPEIVNHKEMGVSFSSWLKRDPKSPRPNTWANFDRELWWERNCFPDIQMVANDLHALGLLEAGDYIIEIDW